jgi:hypothetical protein
MIIRKYSDTLFNRKWETRLGFSFFEGFQLEYNTYLTQFEGEDRDHLVSGYFIGFRIKNWKIESYHTYYDGENCFWQFGPFAISRFGVITGCKKCQGDIE